MKEKVLNGNKNGMAVLLGTIVLYVVAFILLVINISSMRFGVPVLVITILWLVLGWIPLLGLKILKPNEALVLTLFGKYVGTLKEEGFYFVNPFCTAVNPAAKTKLSQSGDVDGGRGSALLSAALTKSVEQGSNVDNYKEYLSLQCDSAVRNIVRIYPYDVAPGVDTTGDGREDDGSLRGSSELVASRIRDEIQAKVSEAGIEIIEARITYLAYAPEIAAVMLQRQQASAIIDARKMIVDGAVGMVEMALEKLNENNIVELDEERKAAMVSNLLVVLCGNKDAQPIVNSGSLY